jgi:mono/diheme cytochrome c family protein
MPLLRATLVTPVMCLLLLLGLAACGGGDEDGAEPSGGQTAPAEGASTGDAAAGAEVFESAGCGNCHTLDAAHASGGVGPNLDDVQPSFETVVSQVTNGGGGMPAFEGELTEKEIRNVAAFVAENAGG